MPYQIGQARNNFVGPGGLEPPTYALKGQCYYQLSYEPIHVPPVGLEPTHFRVRTGCSALELRGQLLAADGSEGPALSRNQNYSVFKWWASPNLLDKDHVVLERKKARTFRSRPLVAPRCARRFRGRVASNRMIHTSRANHRTGAVRNNSGRL